MIPRRTKYLNIDSREIRTQTSQGTGHSELISGKLDHFQNEQVALVLWIRTPVKPLGGISREERSLLRSEEVMTGYSPTLSTDTIREDGTRSWWRAFSGHQTQKGFFKFPYQITINQTSSLGNSQRQVVFPLSRPTMQNGRQNTVGEHSDETEPADRQPAWKMIW
jgi:hypothetical protein